MYGTIEITPIITVFGGIAVAGATYWFTKEREHDAEIRKEKLDHYKEFAIALSGVVSGEATPEAHRAFALACNKLMLIAPQSVIESLRDFQQEIKISNTTRNAARHDELMTKLFYVMRQDLRIAPADDRDTFRVWLWASGHPKPDAICGSIRH